jgi:hypothetical protein
LSSNDQTRQYKVGSVESWLPARHFWMARHFDITPAFQSSILPTFHENETVTPRQISLGSLGISVGTTRYSGVAWWAQKLPFPEKRGKITGSNQ